MTEGIFTNRIWKQIALEVMRRDGIVKMPGLTEEQIKTVTNHLRTKMVYNAHVAAKGTEPPLPAYIAAKQKRWPAFSHSMVDIVTAPFILEMAMELSDFVYAYFDGEMPRLYSMNAFWTQPSPSPQYKDTHEWHRDVDDFRQLVIFTYGTSIEKTADGAHLYQKGTQIKIPKDKRNLNDINEYHKKANEALGRPYDQPPYDRIETIVGPAGTTFCSDTSGLHMGLRPKDDVRLLIWSRWGVSNPPQSYYWDKLMPINKDLLGSRYPKDNPVLCEAIKLVVS